MANRIGRLELLFWFVTSIVGAGIALAIVSFVTNTPIQLERTRYPWLQAVWLLAAALVMLKAIVSRFHDIGWAVLIIAVPLVDLAALLFLVLAPGQKQANAYGEPSTFRQRLRNLA
jgi:uncharacterized membrane protein YhaH (DUF805 family)